MCCAAPVVPLCPAKLCRAAPPPPPPQISEDPLRVAAAHLKNESYVNDDIVKVGMTFFGVARGGGGGGGGLALAGHTQRNQANLLPGA